MTSTVYRQGRLRPGGQRPWRVTAYVPDATYPYGRVRFKLPCGGWTQRIPKPGQTVDDVFDEVENGLGDVNLTHMAATSSGACCETTPSSRIGRLDGEPACRPPPSVACGTSLRNRR